MHRKRQRNNNSHSTLKVKIGWHFHFWILGSRNRKTVHSRKSKQIDFNNTKWSNNHWNKRIMNNIKTRQIFFCIIVYIPIFKLKFLGFFRAEQKSGRPRAESFFFFYFVLRFLWYFKSNANCHDKVIKYKYCCFMNYYENLTYVYICD